ISFYVELLEQPDNPDAFRDVKTKTLKLAVEAWRSEGQFAEAIRQFTDWIGKARPNEARNPDYMELRMMLAQLSIDYSNQLKKANPKDEQIAPMLKEAKTQLQFVAKYPNDLQQDARKLLAEVGGGSAVSDERPEPTTFEEAKVAGRETLGELQTAEQVLKVLPARLAKESDAKIKAELQKQLDEAKTKVVTARSDALRYFRKALQLANEETDAEDLNVVRYFLAYLYHTQQDYYDSAVLGEFVARRSPLSSAARQCAKIAMVSYLKLYSMSTDEDKTFESERIVGICDYITKQWSDQPEAVDALNTLIPFMIKNGELEQALAYLKDIPETAPQRGLAELKTGQALWSSYIKGMADVRGWKADTTTIPAGVNVADREKELDDLKQRAAKTLADGVGRMQQVGTIDETVATAVLSLAQIYVDTEQADKAIPLLEDPKFGVLTLVKAKHPATDKAGFSSEAYKTGLRAYIASLATAGENGDQLIQKASEMMDGLKESVGDSGQAQLVAIYLSLARDLEEQMKLISSPAAKTAMSKGFETFLKRVRGQSNEFNILNWVAETFRGMAEAFDTGKGELSAETIQYYAEASSTYDTILQKAGTPGWLPQPQYKLQIQLQVAAINRRIGKYQEAVNSLEAILKDNKMVLGVQLEAAKTYQEWAGDSRANPKMYELALGGAREDEKSGEKLIWGWIKLSKMTANKEQFADAFHESRLNIARSYLEYAQRSQGADQQERLDRAKRAIEFTAKLYPEMGGEKWKPQYDQTLRQIQSKLGEKQVGLAEFIAADAGG
ncbi:MAG: hypothetical protein KDA71_06395, partial [Planctomycetales bacterium]|nr:hypothetical protein [Planctomycetales bacterium]